MMRAVVFACVVVFASASCNNAADIEAIFSDTAKWDSDLSTCARGCFAAVQCTADCIESVAQISTGCALCFGEVSYCGADKCALPCLLNPNGSSCRDCVDQNCNDALYECSGLDEVPRSTVISAIDYVDEEDVANFAKLIKMGQL